MIVIVLESLCAIDAGMTREWKLKPGQKICCSCGKVINNVTMIAPIDDCDIGDIVGKDAEEDCDTLTREACKKVLQDQVKLFGLLPLKPVSSRDKFQYGKRKLHQVLNASLEALSSALDISVNYISVNNSFSENNCCQKSLDKLDKLVEMIKQKFVIFNPEQKK